jgi:hypothetical protein
MARFFALPVDGFEKYSEDHVVWVRGQPYLVSSAQSVRVDSRAVPIPSAKNLDQAKRAAVEYLQLLAEAKSPGHAWWVEEVTVLPRCEMRGCKSTAIVHGRNRKDGKWVYMCTKHHLAVGVGLGPSQGLVLVKKYKSTPAWGR